MFLLYMAAINPDPFTNGSISTIIEDGLAYYIIPKEFRFFRAKKGSRYNITPDFSVLTLNPGAFFGVYNMDPRYIESYEDKYGVIFAFETTRSYKLLALDHPETKEILYTRVPPNIQDVLRINYGYTTRSGNRNSQLNSDLVLSQYLCENGYQGYATHFMETDTGDFDPEFMICDVGGITPLDRITNDPRRIKIIVDRGKADKINAELEASRQEKRKNRQRHESPSAARARPMSFAPTNLFASYDSPPRSPSSSGILNFSLGDMDDEDAEENSPPPPNKKLLLGGLRQKKRRSYKKRKTRTTLRKRKRTRRKKSTRRRR